MKNFLMILVCIICLKANITATGNETGGGGNVDKKFMAPNDFNDFFSTPYDGVNASHLLGITEEQTNKIVVYLKNDFYFNPSFENMNLLLDNLKGSGFRLWVSIQDPSPDSNLAQREVCRELQSLKSDVNKWSENYQKMLDQYISYFDMDNHLKIESIIDAHEFDYILDECMAFPENRIQILKRAYKYWQLNINVK